MGDLSRVKVDRLANGDLGGVSVTFLGLVGGFLTGTVDGLLTFIGDLLIGTVDCLIALEDLLGTNYYRLLI